MQGMFSFLGYSGMFLIAGGFGVLGLLAVMGRWCGGDKLNDELFTETKYTKAVLD